MVARLRAVIAGGDEAPNHCAMYSGKFAPAADIRTTADEVQMRVTAIAAIAALGVTTGFAGHAQQVSQPNGAPPNSPAVGGGYWYHDTNHANDPSQSSPAAVYNANRGTWLWPPANDRR
jgi:hypothetical protein